MVNRKVLAALLVFFTLAGCSATRAANNAAAPTMERAQATLSANPAALTALPATAVAQGVTPSPTARATQPQAPMPPTLTPPPATSTALPTAAPTAPPPVAAAAAPPSYSYPMKLPGRPPGDGFYIRDAYAVENLWFKPGWWHTAEDWYKIGSSTVGVPVYAVADGTVVYADANYPGRVVIIRQNDGLFSMYGHLDPALKVKVGQQVARGDALGVVGPDWAQAPGHLHFEIRTFLTTREVNGAVPRYGYPCGRNCPPGPGYWPINAPDHPSDMGWRNPTQTIARRAFADMRAGSLGEVVVVTQPMSASLTLWSAPPDAGGATQAPGSVALAPGTRYPLLEVHAGAPDSRGTSALAYDLWYRIQIPDGRSGWAQAAVPSAKETGSDGRPDGIRFNFVPVINQS